MPDEVFGGQKATEALLNKEHRRIGFINLGDNALHDFGEPVQAATGRLEGYKAALAKFDVPFDETLVRYTDHTPQTNNRLTKELMQLTDPPTAIFCGNDRTAMGCYGALMEMGLRIPDDIAVIGFDNQVDIAQGLWPPLSTIQLPHYEMGKWAVDSLIEIQNGNQSKSSGQYLLECPLVQRFSI